MATVATTVFDCLPETFAKSGTFMGKEYAIIRSGCRIFDSRLNITFDLINVKQPICLATRLSMTSVFQAVLIMLEN